MLSFYSAVYIIVLISPKKTLLIMVVINTKLMWYLNVKFYKHIYTTEE